MDNRKRSDNRGYDNSRSHVSSGGMNSSYHNDGHKNGRASGSGRSGSRNSREYHRRQSWEGRRGSADSSGGREKRHDSDSFERRGRHDSDSFGRRGRRESDSFGRRDEQYHHMYRRHSTDDEEGFDRRRRHERDDFHCLECGGHIGQDHRCLKCGREMTSNHIQRRDESSRGSSSDLFHSRDRHRDRVRDRDRDRDRDRERDRDRDDLRLHKRQRRDNFPPSFESSSSDYVFDAQTGFFYEERNDFFYDPKSKLYYSNERKVYYRYEENPPASATSTIKVNEGGRSKTDNKSRIRSKGKFELVEESEGKKVMKIGNGSDANEMDVGQDLIVQALQGDNKTVANHNKKKISICIKQKSLGKTKKDKKMKQKQIKNDAALEVGRKQNTETHMIKAHQENMEIWSQRGKERMDIENEIANDTTSALDVNICTDVSTGARKIRKTKSGKPICLVCRRKFNDVEKLLQHEKKSKLHKFNLEKRSNNIQANSHDEKYIDRARQRRTLYDDQPLAPLIDTSQTIAAPSLDKARDVVEMEISNPSDNLGESNIGNQILRKLMKKSEGGKVDGKERKETNDHLKMEWERIENLAATKKRRPFR